MGTVEETAFLAAGDKVMEKLGKAAMYYPVDGEEISCTVHLDEELTTSPDGFDLKAYQATKTIEALFSEIGKFPQKGERFVIGSYSYEVKSVIPQDSSDIFVLIAVDNGSLS